MSTPIEPRQPIIPSYLRRAIESKPTGGDGAVVYAGDYGWYAKYPDGTVELLVELIGLAGTLLRYGLDKSGEPIEAGDIISTNLTVETLNLLALEDLLLLAGPLGIKATERDQVISELTEKLKIK